MPEHVGQSSLRRPVERAVSPSSVPDQSRLRRGVLPSRLAERILVEVDPSVADWTPDCFTCGRQIASWDAALALPASVCEDDPPDGVVFVHKLDCAPLDGRSGPA